ncbi:MAG: hypothetical protein J7K00_02870 [Candidatus Diapherotrites archaeon]|nr:hypothetical protein [Candidatus Diapherotrites archaeon]
MVFAGLFLLKFLGEVAHISKSGRVVLRCRKPPKIGAKVYLDSEKPVGFVFDVFGPVEEPFVSVNPKKELLQGNKLFVEDNPRGKKYRH